MKNTYDIASVALLACVGLGCQDDALKSGAGGSSGTGGQGTAGSLAGAVGWGGAATGGIASGGGGDAGGPGESGGKAAGGTGGKGSNAGGATTGGYGGSTICPPSGVCPDLDCPGGLLPNPSNPCACPVCAPADAGPGKDAGSDACLPLPCLPLASCAPGYRLVTPPCACPTCVLADAGTTDAIECPSSCPLVRCAYGTVRDACGCSVCLPPDAGNDGAADACVQPPCMNISCAPGYVVTPHACGCPTCEALDAGYPDTVACPPIECDAVGCIGRMIPNPANPCACPICEPSDAGVDTARPDCTGLDECACVAAPSCSVISDGCYCPQPTCCTSSICELGGDCVCRGGKFLGCAPAELNTCPAAKARVASMCPTLSGATFDGLCQQTDTACTTACLNQVTACGHVACSFCEACDCAGDAFSACLAKCRSVLAQ